MELNREALKTACAVIARNTMWERRPIDVESMNRLASAYERIALEHLEFVVDQDRDPNLIVRAVEYLDVHAIPPMRDDTDWFRDMLIALVDLSCPNHGGSVEYDEFYKDIEAGIAFSRAEYE